MKRYRTEGFERCVVMDVIRRESQRLVCAEVGTGRAPFEEIGQRVDAACKYMEAQFLQEQSKADAAREEGVREAPQPG